MKVLLAIIHWHNLKCTDYKSDKKLISIIQPISYLTRILLKAWTVAYSGNSIVNWKNNKLEIMTNYYETFFLPLNLHVTINNPGTTTYWGAGLTNLLLASRPLVHDHPVSLKVTCGLHVQPLAFVGFKFLNLLNCTVRIPGRKICFHWVSNLARAPLYEFAKCSNKFRSRRGWENNIAMDIKEIGFNKRNWIDSAQDMNYWNGIVNAALNLRAPKAMKLVMSSVAIEKYSVFEFINNFLKLFAYDYTSTKVAQNSGKLSYHLWKIF